MGITTNKLMEIIKSQQEEEKTIENKINFNETVQALEEHIKELYENNSNPTFEGAMNNFLTSI